MNYIKPSSENIGTALGQGLSYMAQSKMAQMQQRQGQEQTFKLLTMLGAPENHAAALALAPKEVLEKILPTYIPALARQQDMGQQQQQQQPQESMAQLQGMSQAAPSQEAALGAPKADLMQGQDRQKLQEDLSQKVNQPKIAQPLAPTQQPVIQPKTAVQKQQKMSALGGGITGPSDKIKASNAAMHKGYIKQVTDQGDYAKEAIRALDEISAIDKKGGTTIDPKLYGFLEKIDFPIEGWLSPDSTVINKLQGVFFRGLKPTFGARPTDVDVKAWMKTFPTLMMTPEGRAIVSRNMKNMLERDILRSDAIDQIFDELGYVPFNIHKQVEDKIKPQIKALDEQFNHETALAKVITQKPDTGFDKLPDAKDMPNITITDQDTGKKVKSDGKKWNPA